MIEREQIIQTVNKIKRRDQLAMHAIYQQFAKQMLNLSFRITNDLASSEDIIQEAFLQSFLKIDQLKDASRYGSWLKRMVANKSIDSISNRIYFEAVNEQIIAEDEDPHWYKKIDFAEIQKAIQSLPNGFRQVFTLYLLDGFKHKEIAEMLKTSESNTKSQYGYAKKLLQTKLKSYKYV